MGFFPRHRLLGRLGAFLALSALLSAPALAEGRGSEAANAPALELFSQGRALLEQRHYADAAAKFEESFRLGHGGGTLLNLALCHELLGRTASAWAEFNEALRRARLDQRPDRESFAAAHLSALEPRLSRLRVVVAASADSDDLKVFRDSMQLGRAAWGTPIPVDPGEQMIEARAPGKRPWKIKVRVAAEGDLVTVQVPVLEDMAKPRAAPVEVERPSNVKRPLGVALGVLGIGALGLGSYFGLHALKKDQESDEQCGRPPTRCNDLARSLESDARASADRATVLFAAGAVALGAGAYLWVTGASQDTAIGLAPGIGGTTAFGVVGRRAW